MSETASEEALAVVEVFKNRLAALQRIRDNPECLLALLAYYRTDGDTIADFINDWGITVDPRNATKGVPTILPFTLDAKQREWIVWTHDNFKRQKYGGTEKSRDVGVSWLVVAYSITLCILFEGIDVGLGSFKQEKVDKAGMMGSLFEKARCYADALPPEFTPGFDIDNSKCSKDRLLTFPGTRSTIFGEIGDDIGRGNRASIYFVDEAAYLEHDQIVDAALSKTTNCRQDVSSVCGMENTFAQRMHKAGINKFTFHWRFNPRFTQKDYDEFLDTWGETITAQELDINYQASVEGIIIRPKWVAAAVDAHKKLPFKVEGIKQGSLDVADTGRDKNAFASRHGPLVTTCRVWTGKDSDIFATTETAFDICDELDLEGFVYDADGLGAGVRGDSTRIAERRKLQHERSRSVDEFRGSNSVFMPEMKIPGTDRLAKDMFQNHKAQSWWQLKTMFEHTFRALNKQEYDPEYLISLDSTMDPNDLQRLTNELCQPRWKRSVTGKLMVDKTPDGAPSPNTGDSVMQLFAPRAMAMKINDSILDDENELETAEEENW